MDKCKYGHYYPKEFSKNCIYCRELKERIENDDK